MQGCFHAKIQNGDCIVKPLLDRGFYEGNLRGSVERKRTTGIRCGEQVIWQTWVRKSPASFSGWPVSKCKAPKHFWNQVGFSREPFNTWSEKKTNDLNSQRVKSSPLLLNTHWSDTSHIRKTLSLWIPCRGRGSMGRGVASDPFLMWETDNSNQINKITCYAQVADKK